MDDDLLCSKLPDFKEFCKTDVYRRRSRCFPLCLKRCTEVGYEGWNEGTNLFRSSALAWKYGSFVGHARWNAARPWPIRRIDLWLHPARQRGARSTRLRTGLESSRVEPVRQKNGGPHWAQARKRRHVNKLQNIFTFKAGRSRMNSSK